MYALMYVLDDPDKLDAVLEAWREVGVGGVTIIESSGIYRRQLAGKHIPMRFGFERLMERAERGNYTLLTFVNDETVVQRCADAVEQVVGELSQPNTGILVAWPLTFERGLTKERKA